MLNLLLFGPPGAGKGTQSEKLIQKYGLIHLSTGEILRSEIARETTLGLEARNFIDQGKLVPDKTVIDMIAVKIDDNAGAKGFIFDGFPRNCDQALALDRILEERNTLISLMITLEVDYNELISRLLLRSEKEGRSDDTREVIENRIKLYREVTEPVIEHYKKLDKFRSVDGIGKVDEIFHRVVAAVEDFNH
jgi:adenylate kinase